MLLDLTSLTPGSNFQCKFIRVGNEVHISEPGDIDTLHIQLAKKDKILERVENLKRETADEVDGGILFIQGHVIQVGSSSATLSVPLTDRARKITLQKLKHKNPEFHIKEVMDNS